MSNLYRLYIDESGDHTYGKKELRQFRISQGGKIITEFPIDEYPQLKKDDKRYLALVGCIVEKDYYGKIFKPSLEKIKVDLFPSHSEEKPVIFHRKEIINHEGAFGVLQDPAKEAVFNKTILEFISNSHYIVLAVVIDKLEHVSRYIKPFQPYHYCLALLLERYCGFLKFKKAKGDVLAESRGGVEDSLLKEEYLRLYSHGTQQNPASFFQAVLTSKEIKLKKKEHNIAGLHS